MADRAPPHFSMAGFIQSQLCTKLPYPTTKFTGQTIIVTGSNVGIGLEAARHFVRLDAARVILAVRSMSKGKDAAESITRSTEREGVVEVWELDLASYVSVKAFAERAKGLDRLDVVVANAGIYTFNFSMVEDNETTITVNVVSTLLLAISLLPKLRETSVALNKTCVLTFTGSFVHYLTKFPERNNANIFKYLAKREVANMDDRYNVSKLIELLLVRQLAKQVTESESSHGGHIVVSIINPGFVSTSIMREASPLLRAYHTVMKKMLSRTAEEGARTLVHAAEGAEETHGQYLHDCKVGRVSPYVESEEGSRTQKQLWKELLEKLQSISPAVIQNL